MICNRCNGNGAVLGAWSTELCTECGGSGEISLHRDRPRARTFCESCHGSGIGTDPMTRYPRACQDCGGSGVEESNRNLVLAIVVVAFAFALAIVAALVWPQ